MVALEVANRLDDGVQSTSVAGGGGGGGGSGEAARAVYLMVQGDTERNDGESGGGGIGSI
ncbi:hypothetical protein TYRP_011306 [Tyrophagus putrescentiae]|nr:hypothetical protein TYRP_011306 [Tyrophagus putrescentiae]